MEFFSIFRKCARHQTREKKNEEKKKNDSLSKSLLLNEKKKRKLVLVNQWNRKRMKKKLDFNRRKRNKETIFCWLKARINHQWRNYCTVFGTVFTKKLVNNRFYETGENTSYCSSHKHKETPFRRKYFFLFDTLYAQDWSSFVSTSNVASVNVLNTEMTSTNSATSLPDGNCSCLKMQKNRFAVSSNRISCLLVVQKWDSILMRSKQNTCISLLAIKLQFIRQRMAKINQIKTIFFFHYVQ